MTEPQGQRRAEVYAARRIPVAAASLFLPWHGYARCPACGWWTATPGVEEAEDAAAAHRCADTP